MELLLKLTGNSESLVLQIYDIDTKEWKERISLEKVEKGFFVKSKIANLEYHTNNNITSNERLLAWSDKEPIKYYQKSSPIISLKNHFGITIWNHMEICLQ
ncbi:hypothetical protein SS593_02655 [Streptococcus agalactiae]|uniref:hypothetical protein n=1 Tax=Streptococcus agalactiae TaxID=1311 RepID=UPI0022EAF50D|nr:hypothetical protein [Streptococcus agalactiae]